MPRSQGAVWAKLPASAAALGFAVLAAALAATGQLPTSDAVWASASVLIGFLPSGWYASTGWRRRAAEAALLPAVCAMLLVPDLAVRRLLLPPLLIGATTAALVVALPRVPVRRRPLLFGLLGVAARAACGLGLVGAGPLTIAAVLATSLITPWAAAHWGTAVGLVCGLLMGVLPTAHWPLAALAVAAVAVFLYPWARSSNRPDDAAVRWLPAVAAFAAITGALAPWGGMPVARAFPAAGLLAVAGLAVAAAVTLRMTPALAGIVWFLLVTFLGPVQGPSPEGRSVTMTSASPTVALPAGTGGKYLVDLALRNARRVDAGTPVASVEIAGATTTLRAGSDAADALHQIPRARSRASHPLPDRPVWRPARIGHGGRWRVAGRSRLDVARGEVPVLRRDPDLPDRVQLTVETAGPSRPTPPRDWTFDAWLWAAAAVVLLLQLASGAWRSGAGSVPWCLLTAGQAVARVSIEPLRLAGERYGVDLCLAAVLAAWLPAAWGWLRAGHRFRAAAALLVPLALATPHLTPPLYGDEPFHLLVMESLVSDHDTDITDDLDLEHHPGNSLYTISERPMHSPVLAIMLLPGYLVAGRSGALLLMALAGAATAASIGRYAEHRGLPRSRGRLLTVALVVTYPIATFSTQIWPAIPGALAVAVILGLTVQVPRAGWYATLVALAATTIKTRLALVTFPAALVVWLKSGRRRWALAVVVLASAAAVGLGVGWLTMGHPFGAFRRARDLLPDDPVLAVRVIAGLLFDHAGGLAFAAPLLLAATACLPLLWRHGDSPERAVIAGGGLTILALLNSLEWYGGGSPPARYLVPLLPALALAWALVLRRPYRWRRLGELLGLPSLVVWWALIARPHFSVNPGDGSWWLADALARRFAADTRQFFPSFMVPNSASYWLPPALVAAAAVAAWLTARQRCRTGTLVRLGLGLWLVVAAALTVAIATRCDRTVEIEAAQVRRQGGRPVPPPGTPSRFTHRTAWRIGNGEAVVVPLNLPRHPAVYLEGWLAGSARAAAQLRIRWDDGRDVMVPVRGDTPHGRIRLPDPPAAGRHRLRISVRCPSLGAAVLDRVVIDRPRSGLAH